MKVIVVGAGVIGALTAYQLAVRGADVTVIEAVHPAAGCSGASFGWINASFYLDRDHFALRHNAIQAHRRLAQTLRTSATVWQGCLCWEEQGAAFDTQHTNLRALGYDVREIDGAEFTRLEPEVSAPQRALYFAQEGAADLTVLAGDALSAAKALGARFVAGVAVSRVETRGGRVSGVRWSGGTIAADHVVLATGTATPVLLSQQGVSMPMLDRPGVLLQTAPLPPILSHILVSPEQELRQDPTGRLLAPMSAAHQSDTSEKIEENLIALADQVSERVGKLVQRDITWEQMTLANRPMPGDGRPVIGSCGPEGLYVSSMHSGATLAPLAAEIVASEVLEQPLSPSQARMIAPYRPQRFTI